MSAPALLGTLETALYAADLTAAARFYGGILGLAEIARQDGRHVFYSLGQSVLLIFNPEATGTPPSPEARFQVPPHGSAGPGHFCFSVASHMLEAWRAHLLASDIAIEADFCWPNGARSIYVRDPAGNSIEFAEPALWF
ncbi:MAG: VOC family protein [Albidovulum sp.]